MGWFDENSPEAKAHDDIQRGNHKASFGHEFLGGAAAFAAAKAYEDHCAKNGKPASHAAAKEILAGFAGAFIDREFETKGLDFIDRETAERAKGTAQRRINEQVNEDQW